MFMDADVNDKTEGGNIADMPEFVGLDEVVEQTLYSSTRCNLHQIKQNNYQHMHKQRIETTQYIISDLIQ